MLAANPSVELKMVPCGDQGLLCPVNGSLPRGVLFTAYSTDKEQMFHKLIPEVMMSAQSLKRYHGKDLPSCLVTHLPTKFIEASLFDYVIQIREDLLVPGFERQGAGGYTPQWFTRLIYYASSPFKNTLALDGNAGFCGNVNEAFGELNHYDFAVASAAREPCLGDFPHNYIMAYTSSDVTRELFVRWAFEQIKFGIPLDDQVTLSRAIMKLLGQYGDDFRFGIIETSFATSLLHHDNAFFKSSLPALTRSISTFVPIVHPVISFDGSFTEILDYTCGVFNKNPESLRVILETDYGVGGLLEVSSPEECDRFLNKSCAGPINTFSGLPFSCADEFVASGSRVVWRPPSKGSFIRNPSM